MNHRPHRFAIATALTALLSAGCVSVSQTPAPMQALAQRTSGSAGQCDGLNALSDQAAATRLDIPEATLRQLREGAKVDNEGACALAPDARNIIMAAYRKTFRSPDRAKFRAPAKEWMRTWDMDEFGRTPTSTDILRAESDRKALSRTGRTGAGVGEQARSLAAGISTSSWTALGPGNVGGRLRAVLIDPRDANRILVGAATGGIWLSTNGGQSFSAIADFLGNIVIGTMAFDPVNPNTIYVGTGESFTGYQGVGVFKSTDRGVTWNHLGSTSTDTGVNPSGLDWWYVNRIAVSPANPDIILAGTTTGTSTGGITANGKVYRSTNGGASWSKVADFQGLDVKFDPNDANNAIVGSDNGYVYYSNDAGASWTQSMQIVSTPVGRGTPKSARIELDYAKTAPGTVYASVDNNADANADKERGQVWKSLDGGANWAMLAEPKHLNEQGDYNNAIWVSPVDDKHVIVGGLDLYQSFDGGGVFVRISTWQQAGPGAVQPHADHHVIVHAPNYSAGNPVVYFGNDGGLYRSTNVFVADANANSSWQNLNNNLGATQFYGGAGKRAAGGKIIGGTQDNGALMLSQGTNWERTAGGDGGFAAVDPIDDTTIYGEYVYASVHRKVGQNFREYICSGITEALKGTGSTQPYCGLTNAETAKANFIAPFLVDPNNRDRMLVGANSLWMSGNIRSPVPSWRVIKAPIVIGGASSFYINAIAVYERDSNVIWVGHNSPGQIWKTTNGLSVSPTWTQVGDGILPSGTVSRVTIDQDNPNRAWVTYTGFTTGRIWQTTDGGTTWQNIHSNLPRVSLHDIKRHPTQINWLYVAAANGVYTSENGGQSWSTVNDGPGGVRVRELFWYDPSTLVAVTFGRGMFRTTVAGAGPANYSDLWWAGTAENGWGMSIQQHGQIQLNAMYVYDNAGKPIWYVLPGGAWNSDFTTYSGPIYQPTSAPLNNYSAAQFKVGAPVGNISINFTGNSTATLQYVINGISGQKSIQRQIFGRGTSPIQVGDMWWGGTAQDGWGLSITQQAGILFGAWFTYGPDGKAAWYVMTEGTWSGNTYTGSFFSTTSSAWLGVPYDPIQLKIVPPDGKTGTLTLNFSDANNATMTYTFTAGPFAGTTQTKPIVRQPY